MRPKLLENGTKGSWEENMSENQEILLISPRRSNISFAGVQERENRDNRGQEIIKNKISQR